MSESLAAIVRQAEDNLVRNTSKLGKYVNWSLYETTETIFAYLNSQHISGKTDSLGREKPFFNIVSAAVNVWYRATDLDRKDIVVLPDHSGNVVAAFIATVLLHDWMKKSGFGLFLNDWGRTLAQYGSAIVKFIKREGELIATVTPWNRAIVDPIDYTSIPKIEKFYKTPGQLKNMATKGHPDYAGYNIDRVNELLNAVQTRETLDGQNKDNESDFIELYEVHGLLPLAILKDSRGEDVDEADEDVFVQQMHVVSWSKGADNEFVDYTLFSGKEEKDPTMITHLIPEDGRTLAIGAVEYLFDAQWMQNHTIKNWKDQMDLTSKIVFQTADSNFVGKNVLTAIEQGDILVHADSKPLNQVPNVGHDITNLKAFADQWKVLAQEVTSTPDAVRGTTLPSGTPYSLGAYLGSQGLSLFELMTENKGHYLEMMLREFVIPFLKTKMNSKEEIVAILEDHNLKKIDEMFVPREAIRRYNNKVKESLLNNQIPEGLSVEGEAAQVRQELGALGNQRFLSPGDLSWKEIVKDLEWKLDIGITNEQTDKQAVLTSLNTVFQTVAQNPAILQDPNAKLLFNKILSQTNVVSPVELSSTPIPSPLPPAPTAPLPAGQ